MRGSGLATQQMRRMLKVPTSMPTLPPGDRVDLPGRGNPYVVDVAGPPGAPTLLLLHSLACTAMLTWFPVIEELSSRYRMVMLDLRGHGRGIETSTFTLEDCADDAIALCDVLGIDRVIPVGYSMGGPVAQLVWRRHPDRVSGLVLCATAGHFGGTPQERMFYRLLPLVSRVKAGAAVTEAAVEEMLLEALPGIEEMGVSAWCKAEFRSTKPRAMLRALAALGTFDSRGWAGEIDVPTSVVVMTKDHAILTRRQIALGQSIPRAEMFFCHGSHASCVLGADRFVPVLADACDSVVGRLAATRARPGSRRPRQRASGLAELG